MTLFKIENGTIVDPANHASRFVGDLWIRDGKICSRPGPGEKADGRFDATGLVVMPGGVDMHSHFVGPKVNAGRRLNCRTKLVSTVVANSEGETKRPFIPTLERTGLHYAGLGYTTAFDAAVPLSSAQIASQELQAIPCVDAGFFALVGNHHSMLKAVADNDQDSVDQFLEQAVSSSNAWAAKLVNPGGVEDWKSGYRDGIGDIDQPLNEFKTTPREIIRRLADANDRLALPHAIHIHCNRLGLPGNWQTTLKTMQALGDCRGHFAHIQFHSYRGADDEASFGSAVKPLVEYVNGHTNISVDVGQIMFGSTMSMTADSALGYYLQSVTGKPWVSHDTAFECGCGVSPIRYRQRDRIHGLQWAIGLEWMLLMNDPWRLALSTDHPNGASFLAYPQVIALLMDRTLRERQLMKLHDGVREHATLHDIDREYSLEEIAIVTRAAPARLLGLESKGHLGVGADADVVVYRQDSDIEAMFQFPRLVIKSGIPIIDDGQLLATPAAKQLSASSAISDKTE